MLIFTTNSLQNASKGIMIKYLHFIFDGRSKYSVRQLQIFIEFLVSSVSSDVKKIYIVAWAAI